LIEVLSSAHRMRRSAEFTATVRGGRRAARPTLVLHQRSTVADDAPRVGFIVSRSVGNSVVRHRVARQLRAACAALVDGWQSGDQVVIRALPAAASASFSQLGEDLESAYARLTGLKGEGNFA